MVLVNGGMAQDVGVGGESAQCDRAIVNRDSAKFGHTPDTEQPPVREMSGFEEDLDRLLRLRVLDGGRSVPATRQERACWPDLSIIEARSETRCCTT